MTSDSTTDVMCSDCERSFTVYEDEVRAFYRFHRCWPPPERAILQDLIAGLRKSITDVCGDSLYAEGINMDFYFRDQITRAEARLREVQGE